MILLPSYMIYNIQRHLSFLLKRETDFNELQFLKNHLKSKILILRIKSGLYFFYFVYVSFKQFFFPQKTQNFEKMSRFGDSHR